MPDLQSLLSASSKPVATTPGYEAKSALEAAAPSTPVTSSDLDKEQSLSPPDKPKEEMMQTPSVVCAPPRGASLPTPATQASAAHEHIHQTSPVVPPEPLKIRPREAALSPDNVSIASTALPYTGARTPLPTPPLHKVTFGGIQEPTPVQPTEERREVKFAPVTYTPDEEEEELPTSARSVGSRFAGASLKLKNWGSKARNDKDRSEKDETPPPQSAPVPSQVQTNGDNKSPLGGFKGLSFWRQKETDDPYHGACISATCGG